MAIFDTSREFVLEKADVEQVLDAYNRKRGTRLKLGKLIGSGIGYVYDVSGTDTPQVVKVVDTRRLTRSDKAGGGPFRRCTKTVHPQTLDNQRWLYQVTKLEIESMQKLAGNPNVMPLCDAFEYTDPFWENKSAEACNYERTFLIFMPKLVPLENYIQVGKISEDVLVRMAADICNALSGCQNINIIHRDLKPDNIYARMENGSPSFVLGDFGAAHRMQSQCETGVTRVGTEKYWSPEVCYGRTVTYSADVYSLGMVLYYLISGQFPYTQITATGTVPAQPRPLEDISPQLAAVIYRAIQYAPDKRYASAGELRGALLPVQRTDTEISGGPFKAAKHKLLDGKVDEALEIAERNLDSTEPNGVQCLSLAGYIRYGCAAAAAKPLVGRQVENDLLSAVQVGDPLASCVIGMIYMDRASACRKQGNEKGRVDCQGKAVIYLRRSAEAGYTLAMYLYGRILYENRCPDVQACDKKQGLDYIRRACDNGYLEAVRIFQRIAERDPDVRIGAAANELMKLELGLDDNYDERRVASLNAIL